MGNGMKGRDPSPVLTQVGDHSWQAGNPEPAARSRTSKPI